jgi:glycosyltransferase involved in cell wall biosynthesis
VRDVWFAIPGDLATATGGYAYARRLIDALPAAGWHPRLLPLPAGFPDASADDLRRSYQALATLPSSSLVLVDGLAFGVLPRDRLDRLGHRWVALVHHPLALESGIGPAAAARLRVSEREALGAARAVIATSPHTATTLAAEYGVAAGRIHVAVPGTKCARPAQGGGAVPNLLSVATVTARKAHDVLVQALARIRELSWRCRIIGSLERDPATASQVAAQIRASDLEGRISLEGEVADVDLEAAYEMADIFVLPSRHEGYGMAFAEALAHGLPVVACAVGAVPQTVPPQASLLVAPDDVEALAAALTRMLVDTALKRRLADAAWAHGRALPSWADTARSVAAALTAAST